MPLTAGNNSSSVDNSKRSTNKTEKATTNLKKSQKRRKMCILSDEESGNNCNRNEKVVVDIYTTCHPASCSETVVTSSSNIVTTKLNVNKVKNSKPKSTCKFKSDNNPCLTPNPLLKINSSSKEKDKRSSASNKNCKNSNSKKRIKSLNSSKKNKKTFSSTTIQIKLHHSHNLPSSKKNLVLKTTSKSNRKRNSCSSSSSLNKQNKSVSRHRSESAENSNGICSSIATKENNSTASKHSVSSKSENFHNSSLIKNNKNHSGQSHCSVRHENKKPVSSCISSTYTVGSVKNSSKKKQKTVPKKCLEKRENIESSNECCSSINKEKIDSLMSSHLTIDECKNKRIVNSHKLSMEKSENFDKSVSLDGCSCDKKKKLKLDPSLKDTFKNHNASGINYEISDITNNSTFAKTKSSVLEETDNVSCGISSCKNIKYTSSENNSSKINAEPILPIKRKLSDVGDNNLKKKKKLSVSESIENIACSDDVSFQAKNKRSASLSECSSSLNFNTKSNKNLNTGIRNSISSQVLLKENIDSNSNKMCDVNPEKTMLESNVIENTSTSHEYSNVRKTVSKNNNENQHPSIKLTSLSNNSLSKSNVQFEDNRFIISTEKSKTDLKHSFSQEVLFSGNCKTEADSYNTKKQQILNLVDDRGKNENLSNRDNSYSNKYETSSNKSSLALLNRVDSDIKNLNCRSQSCNNEESDLSLYFGLSKEKENQQPSSSIAEDKISVELKGSSSNDNIGKFNANSTSIQCMPNRITLNKISVNIDDDLCRKVSKSFVTSESIIEKYPASVLSNDIYANVNIDNKEQRNSSNKNSSICRNENKSESIITYCEVMNQQSLSSNTENEKQLSNLSCDSLHKSETLFKNGNAVLKNSKYKDENSKTILPSNKVEFFHNSKTSVTTNDESRNETSFKVIQNNNSSFHRNKEQTNISDDTLPSCSSKSLIATCNNSNCKHNHNLQMNSKCNKNLYRFKQRKDKRLLRRKNNKHFLQRKTCHEKNYKTNSNKHKINYNTSRKSKIVNRNCRSSKSRRENFHNDSKQGKCSGDAMSVNKGKRKFEYFNYNYYIRKYAKDVGRLPLKRSLEVFGEDYETETVSKIDDKFYERSNNNNISKSHSVEVSTSSDSYSNAVREFEVNSELCKIKQNSCSNLHFTKSNNNKVSERSDVDILTNDYPCENLQIIESNSDLSDSDGENRLKIDESRSELNDMYDKDVVIIDAILNKNKFTNNSVEKWKIATDSKYTVQQDEIAANENSKGKELTNKSLRKSNEDLPSQIIFDPSNLEEIERFFPSEMNKFYSTNKQTEDSDISLHFASASTEEKCSLLNRLDDSYVVRINVVKSGKNLNVPLPESEKPVSLLKEPISDKEDLLAKDKELTRTPQETEITQESSVYIKEEITEEIITATLEKPIKKTKNKELTQTPQETEITEESSVSIKEKITENNNSTSIQECNKSLEDINLQTSSSIMAEPDHKLNERLVNNVEQKRPLIRVRDSKSLGIQYSDPNDLPENALTVEAVPPAELMVVQECSHTSSKDTLTGQETGNLPEDLRNMKLFIERLTSTESVNEHYLARLGTVLNSAIDDHEKKEQLFENAKRLMVTTELYMKEQKKIEKDFNSCMTKHSYEFMLMLEYMLRNINLKETFLLILYCKIFAYIHHRYNKQINYLFESKNIILSMLKRNKCNNDLYWQIFEMEQERFNLIVNFIFNELGFYKSENTYSDMLEKLLNSDNFSSNKNCKKIYLKKNRVFIPVNDKIREGISGSDEDIQNQSESIRRKLDMSSDLQKELVNETVENAADDDSNIKSNRKKTGKVVLLQIPCVVVCDKGVLVHKSDDLNSITEMSANNDISNEKQNQNNSDITTVTSLVGNSTDKSISCNSTGNIKISNVSTTQDHSLKSLPIGSQGKQPQLIPLDNELMKLTLLRKKQLQESNITLQINNNISDTSQICDKNTTQFENIDKTFTNQQNSSTVQQSSSYNLKNNNINVNDTLTNISNFSNNSTVHYQQTDKSLYNVNNSQSVYNNNNLLKCYDKVSSDNNRLKQNSQQNMNNMENYFVPPVGNISKNHIPVPYQTINVANQLSSGNMYQNSYNNNYNFNNNLYNVQQTNNPSCVIHHYPSTLSNQMSQNSSNIMQYNKPKESTQIRQKLTEPIHSASLNILQHNRLPSSAASRSVNACNNINSLNIVTENGRKHCSKYTSTTDLNYRTVTSALQEQINSQFRIPTNKDTQSNYRINDVLSTINSAKSNIPVNSQLKAALQQTNFSNSVNLNNNDLNSSNLLQLKDKNKQTDQLQLNVERPNLPHQVSQTQQQVQWQPQTQFQQKLSQSVHQNTVNNEDNHNSWENGWRNRVIILSARNYAVLRSMESQSNQNFLQSNTSTVSASSFETIADQKNNVNSSSQGVSNSTTLDQQMNDWELGITNQNSSLSTVQSSNQLQRSWSAMENTSNFNLGVRNTFNRSVSLNNHFNNNQVLSRRLSAPTVSMNFLNAEQPLITTEPNYDSSATSNISLIQNMETVQDTPDLNSDIFTVPDINGDLRDLNYQETSKINEISPSNLNQERDLNTPTPPPISENVNLTGRFRNCGIQDVKITNVMSVGDQQSIENFNKAIASDSDDVVVIEEIQKTKSTLQFSEKQL
ncbi:uncharacterized protein LOC142323887 isoform X2 [Lycorma delicatula]